MNKTEIINELAKNKKVEEIVLNVTKSNPKIDDTLEDMVQDIYMELLTKKPDSMIEKMYDRGELNYFITKMVINNYFSSTSPYYKKYKESRIIGDSIDKYEGQV